MPLGSIPSTTKNIYIFFGLGLKPGNSTTELPAGPFYLFIFWLYWGLNLEEFYLQDTPPALFFILYFETGSP